MSTAKAMAPNRKMPKANTTNTVAWPLLLHRPEPLWFKRVVLMGRVPPLGCHSWSIRDTPFGRGVNGQRSPA